MMSRKLKRLFFVSGIGILIVVGLIRLQKVWDIVNRFAPDRIAVAREKKDKYLRRLFSKRGVPYPPEGIYLRAFKKERVLELWAYHRGLKRYVWIKDYKFCGTQEALAQRGGRVTARYPRVFTS